MHLLKDRGFIHRTTSEITPPSVYHARREWMQRAAALGLAPWAASGAFAQSGIQRPGKLAPLPGA